MEKLGEICENKKKKYGVNMRKIWGNMEEYGEIRGKHVGIWENMGKYEKIWGNMGNTREIWDHTREVW
jgi:hypothetical protein